MLHCCSFTTYTRPSWCAVRRKILFTPATSVFCLFLFTIFVCLLSHFGLPGKSLFMARMLKREYAGFILAVCLSVPSWAESCLIKLFTITARSTWSLRLSVCGQNRVRSVSFSIFSGPFRTHITNTTAIAAASVGVPSCVVLWCTKPCPAAIGIAHF